MHPSSQYNVSRIVLYCRYFARKISFHTLRVHTAEGLVTNEMLKNLGSEVLTGSAAEIGFYQWNTSFNTSIQKNPDIMVLFQKTLILIQAILCARYKTTSSESDHMPGLKSVLVRRKHTVFSSFSMGIKPCEFYCRQWKDMAGLSFCKN